MNACPECELPMVWSEWYQRMRCCVYGAHDAIPEPPTSSTHGVQCICLMCRPIGTRSKRKAAA